MKEWHKLLIILTVFWLIYLIPWENETIRRSGLEAFMMLQDYAREHVLNCLVPAFFIAGAISVFVSQAAVLKYFGAKASKLLSYSVASISGTILTVCSCTVLPLFAGIYTRGAGIGPAVAFLYSGPAINILAVSMTAKVLGWQMGLARAVGAIFFAVIIGLLMSFFFKRDENDRDQQQIHLPEQDETRRTLLHNSLFIITLVLILLFAAFASPETDAHWIWTTVYSVKWHITAVLLVFLGLMIKYWFLPQERKEWVQATWSFARQITPLLFAGVLAAGFFLGRPSFPALIPEEWIAGLVGGNSLQANLFASLAGALMYFATLTEVPILQGLLGSGMGQGPALALLLAGPALSLPNMLVIAGVMGVKKTIVLSLIIVVMSTLCGLIYGNLF